MMVYRVDSALQDVAAQLVRKDLHKRMENSVPLNENVLMAIGAGGGGGPGPPWEWRTGKNQSP